MMAEVNLALLCLHGSCWLTGSLETVVCQLLMLLETPVFFLLWKFNENLMLKHNFLEIWENRLVILHIKASLCDPKRVRMLDLCSRR